MEELDLVSEMSVSNTYQQNIAWKSELTCAKNPRESPRHVGSSLFARLGRLGAHQLTPSFPLLNIIYVVLKLAVVPTWLPRDDHGPWRCLHRVANQDKGGEFINCCWWHIQLKYGYKSLNHSTDTAGDLQSQVMKKHCNKERGEEKKFAVCHCRNM